MNKIETPHTHPRSLFPTLIINEPIIIDVYDDDADDEATTDTSFTVTTCSTERVGDGPHTPTRTVSVTVLPASPSQRLLQLFVFLYLAALHTGTLVNCIKTQEEFTETNWRFQHIFTLRTIIRLLHLILLGWPTLTTTAKRYIWTWDSGWELLFIAYTIINTYYTIFFIYQLLPFLIQTIFLCYTLF